MLLYLLLHSENFFQSFLSNQAYRVHCDEGNECSNVVPVFSVPQVPKNFCYAGCKYNHKTFTFFCHVVQWILIILKYWHWIAIKIARSSTVPPTDHFEFPKYIKMYLESDPQGYILLDRLNFSNWHGVFRCFDISFSYFNKSTWHMMKIFLPNSLETPKIEG